MNLKRRGRRRKDKINNLRCYKFGVYLKKLRLSECFFKPLTKDKVFSLKLNISGVGVLNKQIISKISMIFQYFFSIYRKKYLERKR